MPPPPAPMISAIETLLASQDDAIAAYKAVVIRASAIPDIRRCGECLRGCEHAARELVRVHARVLAKQGTWGRPWRGAKPKTALRIGALVDADDAMFQMLAAAEADHEQKLHAVLGEGGLPRDVQALLEKIAADTAERRAWLDERTAGIRIPAANGARVAARG
ncbi:hypothetical protein LVJ94_45225 [Pendulispora rubella]|uniref:DUF2383 domain-containing protein n=1 Tax=Pendulispora rubella TaxID=2741070 RepID=A0ABZ2KZS5_9BACT